jgi:hypothetical protein
LAAPVAQGRELQLLMPAIQMQDGEETSSEMLRWFSSELDPLQDFSPPRLHGVSGGVCSLLHKARHAPNLAAGHENLDLLWIV